MFEGVVVSWVDCIVYIVYDFEDVVYVGIVFFDELLDDVVVVCGCIC